jgi:hypothetical protein
MTHCIMQTSETSDIFITLSLLLQLKRKPLLNSWHSWCWDYIFLLISFVSNTLLNKQFWNVAWHLGKYRFYTSPTPTFFLLLFIPGLFVNLYYFASKRKTRKTCGSFMIIKYLYPFQRVQEWFWNRAHHRLKNLKWQLFPHRPYRSNDRSLL